MYCQYCGADYPEGAKFCLECGAPTVQANNPIYNQNGSLRLVRRGGAAVAIKTKIFVDGELKSAIGESQNIAFLLPAGQHTVELKTPGNGRITREIAIKPDIETVIEFKIALFAENYHKILGIYDVPQQNAAVSRSVPVPSAVSQPSNNTQRQGRRCPKCGGIMTVQTVSEGKKAGCGTILLYVILALTIFGLFIVIPLMLRNKTQTVTYAVCQNCGYKVRL